MTLFQVEELASYWAEHPPLHLLIGAYIGAGTAKRAPPMPVSARETQQPRSDIASMIAQLGPGISARDVHAGLSPVILDFVELRRRSTSSN